MLQKIASVWTTLIYNSIFIEFVPGLNLYLKVDWKGMCESVFDNVNCFFFNKISENIFFLKLLFIRRVFYRDLVSISSTLNARILHTNVFFLVTFWLWTNFRTKNARKKGWWNWALKEVRKAKWGYGPPTLWTKVPT